MFDGPFDWTLRNGPRPLLAWTALILLLGVLEGIEMDAKVRPSTEAAAAMGSMFTTPMLVFSVLGP